MSRIRSSGTRSKEAAIDLLEALIGGTCRIERNVRSLPGSPDLVVQDLDLVIFIDGVFLYVPDSWACAGHQAGVLGSEIGGKRSRDERNRRELRRRGYSVGDLGPRLHNKGSRETDTETNGEVRNG